MGLTKSAYITKYTKENIKRIEIKLSKKYDKDIIDILNNVDNVSSYIKDLIRENRRG